MDKNLIFMPNWIGDTLMAMAVINRKVAVEGNRTHLLVAENLKPLIEDVSDLPIISYNRRSRSSVYNAIRKIKSYSFSKVYLLPHSIRTAWIAMNTWIPKRRGIAKEGRGLFLTERISKTLRDKNKHLVNEYSTILETDEFGPEEWDGILHQDICSGAPEFDIVLCPGAKYGPAKQWQDYKGLAELMHPLNIVVLGTANDYSYGEEIRSASPSRVTNMAGKTNINEAVHIISNSKLVISNDSGLMHLAAYIGVPVIGIFGSTSPDWTRPLGKKSVVLNSQLSCAPCFKRECKFGHYNCLKSIGKEQVSNIAHNMLQKYWPENPDNILNFEAPFTMRQMQ